MAERSAAGGRTPPPGDRNGGASPAAASRIRVDISDVDKLKRSIKDTASEVTKLRDLLAKFDSTAGAGVKKATAEIAAMQRALGNSGTRSAAGPKQTTSSGTAANQHAGGFSGAAVHVGRGGGSYMPTPGPAGSAYNAVVVGGGGSSGGPTFIGGLGPTQYAPQQPSYLRQAWSYMTSPAPSGTSRSKPPAWTTTPAFRGAMGALGVASSIGSFAAGHMNDATNRSYLINQQQLLTGGSTSNAAQFGFNRSLVPGMGNTALGYADATSALGTLMTTGVTGGAYGQSRMSSVGFLSNINPMQGNAASAQQLAQTFTSQNYYRMRLAGINASTANGQNMQSMFDQIINRIQGAMGRSLTAQEIQTGAQQGSHLNADLTAMGLSPDVIQNLLQYWAARVRTGRTGVAAVRGAGGQHNLAYARQRAGAAQARAGANIDQGYIPGATQGARILGHEWNAVGAAADTPMGRVASDAAGNLADFSHQLKIATNVIKGIVEWELARTLLGGGKSGILGKAVGALGTRMGLGGAGGALRVAGRAAGLAGAGLLAGAGIDALGRATHHRTTGRILGDAARGAGAGAMVGSVVPVVGTAVGAGVGAGVGAAWGARHQLMHAGSALVSDIGGIFGGSGQDANIWSASGRTFPLLEQMASKGPHEIVTSTISGTHASNSYHYRGQAIDLADAPGSHDSPGLLAINRYLAKNYGHMLAELIYAGPGGVNIKNGKVVNGQAMYGAATMAEHHNHVHVAATPASLKMKGGVSTAGGNPSGTLGQGGPQSATSSGGFATPGGMGFGADNIFSDSSASALFAALSGGSGGAASPRLAAAGGMAGGVAGGAAGGGLGGPPGAMPRGNLAQWERQALSLLRLNYGKYARGLTSMIMHESGGNPHAINNWDSNAKAGHPSKGLMQTIDSTFLAHALPGHKNIWNPVDNIVAGVRYIEGRYGLGMLAGGGNHDARGNYVGYARGVADVLRDEMAMLHKGEMVVQAPEARQIRALLANANAGTHAAHSGPRRAVPVQLVFQVMTGGEVEARRHAKRFAQYVAEEHDIELVAGG